MTTPISKPIARPELVLKPGDPAPDFTAPDQDGNPVSLKGLRGKKVVLFFYPKDDTPGCTEQACNLRDNNAKLIRRGFRVIGVSVDPVKSHKKFEKKFSLPFPLVSDADHAIVERYNLWGEKILWGRRYMGTYRTTFLIDEKGIIRAILDKPDTGDHTEEVLKAWKA